MKHNYKYFIIIFSMLISQETIGPNLYNENLINFLQNNYQTSTTLSYNNARDVLYSEIDIDNNNILKDIHSTRKANTSNLFFFEFFKKLNLIFLKVKLFKAVIKSL